MLLPLLTLLPSTLPRLGYRHCLHSDLPLQWSLSPHVLWRHPWATATKDLHVAKPSSHFSF